MPNLVRHGLEQFNAGEYFECHETLEQAWNLETRPVREMYRAILQVAVAYLHVTRGNLPGALKVFGRSRKWFDRLPDRCQGVDLAQLRADAERVEREARRALADARTEVDREWLKPVVYDSPAAAP